MRRSVDWTLYVILDTQYLGARSPAGLVREVIAGGATLLQLREKEGSTREMIRVGRAMHEVARAAGVPFIVNDRVDVALAIDADGVHVGQEDMPAHLARRLIGADRILGVSAATIEEARRAERGGADYLGVGDVFGTSSKPDAGTPIGLAGLREIARAVPLPVVAIGGVNVANARAVVEAGAAGVAVISAVLGAEDVERAARRLRDEMRREV